MRLRVLGSETNVQNKSSSVLFEFTVFTRTVSHTGVRTYTGQTNISLSSMVLSGSLSYSFFPCLFSFMSYVVFFSFAKIFAQPQKLNQNSTKIKYKINCSIFSVQNLFRLKKNRMNELKSLAHNGFEKWDKNVRNKQSKVEKSVSFSCWCCYCGRFLYIHT